MKFASHLSALAIILFSSLLAAQNNGWNDDAQKCKDMGGDDAIAACTRAIASGQLSQQNLATTYYNRGYEYRAKEEYDAAIADESEAIRLDPTLVGAFNNRGVAFYDKGEYDRAIPDYEKALQLDPKHVNAFYGLGNVYKAKGEYAMALDKYNQALQLNPNFTNVFINRGNVYLAQGEFDRAIADYKDALRTKPSNMYTALLIAVAKMHKGDNAVADDMTAESQAFSKDWPFPVVQYYLGKASEDDMAQAARDPDAQTQRARFCEMYFYLGEWQMFHGQQMGGIGSLKRAKEECQQGYFEYDLVKTELKRLGE
jgi:tetratricopeptide (TPR) repeat protein